MERNEIIEALGILPDTTDAVKVEKLFCAAVLAEGTDVTQRVLTRFNDMRRVLDSGISQQAQPAMCPICGGYGMVVEGIANLNYVCKGCGGTGTQQAVG